MAWIISGILLIALVILTIKHGQKVIIDHREADQYKIQVEQLLQRKQDLQSDIRAQTDLIDSYQKKILTVQEQYKKELNKKSSDLDAYFASQKQMRQSEMDTDFERLWREKEENLNNKYIKLEREELEKEHKIRQEVWENIEAARKSQDDIIADTLHQQQRFEALLEPLKQYEKEQQERLFYTIQVPDEYKKDIEFLLTTVAEKVQHPDVINKLIWAEYVKPYIDATFKRVGIKNEPGIYKLTSLIDGKCYIGKSTNIKKRIADHMKSVVGISTIADQTVHHIIAREGYWNWTIEPIIYCEKEKLSELEKYYIDFFKSNEWGFNKTKGGEG